MTFDDYGAKTVYLRSNYTYTLSINVSTPDPKGEDVYSEPENWDDFVEQE